MSHLADDNRGQVRFPAAVAFVQLMSRCGHGMAPRVLDEIEQAAHWIDEPQHLWVYAVARAERVWLGLEDTAEAVACLEDALRQTPTPT